MAGMVEFVPDAGIAVCEVSAAKIAYKVLGFNSFDELDDQNEVCGAGDLVDVRNSGFHEGRAARR